MTSKGYKKTVRILRKGNGLHANEKKKCLNENSFKHLQDCNDTFKVSPHKVREKKGHFFSHLPDDIINKIMEFVQYEVRFNVYQIKYFRTDNLKTSLLNKFSKLPKTTSYMTKIHEYLCIAHETLQLIISEKNWVLRNKLWIECNSKLKFIERLQHIINLFITYEGGEHSNFTQNYYFIGLSGSYYGNYSTLLRSIVNVFTEIFSYRLRFKSQWSKTHENIFKLYKLFII
uniref:Uncharacterized protein n=1 Tax=viral metagenome TaxID=1070528 RepID=A0A6C0HSV7_9ZZZZ